jgi:hypothetical protein
MGTTDKASILVQGTLDMLILKTLARAKLKRNTQDWEVQTAAIARILRASLGEL